MLPYFQFVSSSSRRVCVVVGWVVRYRCVRRQVSNNKSKQQEPSAFDKVGISTQLATWETESVRLVALTHSLACLLSHLIISNQSSLGLCFVPLSVCLCLFLFLSLSVHNQNPAQAFEFFHRGSWNMARLCWERWRSFKLFATVGDIDLTNGHHSGSKQSRGKQTTATASYSASTHTHN